MNEWTTKIRKLHVIQEFTSCYVRNIDSFTVDEFQSKLSTESWEDIFRGYVEEYFNSNK
jgi:hypothetical protein